MKRRLRSRSDVIRYRKRPLEVSSLASANLLALAAITYGTVLAMIFISFVVATLLVGSFVTGTRRRETEGLLRQR